MARTKVDDLISRRAVIDDIKAMYEWHDVVTEDRLIEHMKMLPAAEPEIIRCKDCKHHHRDNSGTYYCGRKDYGYGWGLNDFCSRAERRGG